MTHGNTCFCCHIHFRTFCVSAQWMPGKSSFLEQTVWVLVKLPQHCNFQIKWLLLQKNNFKLKFVSIIFAVKYSQTKILQWKELNDYIKSKLFVQSETRSTDSFEPKLQCHNNVTWSHLPSNLSNITQLISSYWRCIGLGLALRWRPS